MIITTALEKLQWTKLLLVLLSLRTVYFFVRALYNVSLHPLARYPGPILARATTLPYVWNLYRGAQIDWVKQCHKKYGHVVRVAPNELSYNTEEAWRDIFSHDSPSAGRKWEGLYRKDNPQMQTMQGADDEEHAVLRRIFSPAFSEKSLRNQEPMFKRIANTMVNRIKRYTQENSNPAIDMTEFFMYVTFDIMGDFTFAQPFGLIERMEYLNWIADQYSNLIASIFIMSSAYIEFLKPITSFLMWLFLERLNAPLKFAAEQVDLRVKRNAPEKGSDIWALVFRENKYDRRLTHREMQTPAMLFLLAGTETSASALTSLLWHLHVNPAVSSKLTSEIRTAFKSIDDITLQRCAELEYLQACIEEILRIDSPIKIGLPRVTPPKGMVIDGGFVPGETVVYVTLQAANMSADNFRHPEKFLPERWISDTYISDKKEARQPFSIGTRNCIGKGFAYHEMRLIMATLLFSFDLEVKKESEKWGIGRKVYAVTEKKPLWVVFKPRT